MTVDRQYVHSASSHNILASCCAVMAKKVLFNMGGNSLLQDSKFHQSQILFHQNMVLSRHMTMTSYSWRHNLQSCSIRKLGPASTILVECGPFKHTLQENILVNAGSQIITLGPF